MKKIKNVIYFCVLILIQTNIYNNSFSKSEKIKCGIIALWYCARLEGIDCSIEKVKALFKENQEEDSFYDICQAAQELGLSGLSVKAKWEELLKLKSPAIAHLKNNHFVVIERSDGDKVLVMDYPKPAQLYTREEFEKIWRGALLIVSRPKVQPAKEGSPPKIVFEQLIYDFGPLESDLITSHSFSFYNAGGMTLKITKIDSGCVCIATLIGKNELNPGQRSEIVAKFDTNGRRGINTHKIYVYSNNVENPKVELTLTALVKREIEVNPSRLYFGEVVEGDSSTRELYIIDAGEKKLEIKKVEATLPVIKVEIKPYIEMKDGINRWVMKATLLPQMKEGKIKEKIIITTNSEKKPVIEVPVEGKIVSDLTFVPSKAFFGSVKVGEVVVREIKLLSLKGSEFKIKNFNTNNLPMSVKVNPETKSKEHKVTLELTGPDKTKILKGYIDFIVESDTEQKLNLPVLAIVK